MAGNLKPDVVGLNREASYVVNSYKFHSDYKNPLFDGEISEFCGGHEAYWYGDKMLNDCYLDITIEDNSNIWSLSQPDYFTNSHRAPFIIYLYENKNWINTTNEYAQTILYEKSVWGKTICNIKPGRYKFLVEKNTYRMEAEWYIENANPDYKLYGAEQKIYGMQNGVFNKIVDDWKGLSDEEKTAQFKLTAYKTATVEDLKSISKFKVLTYAETENTPEIKLKVVPKDQLVFPRGLTRIESYGSINKAVLKKTLSSNGICKLLVTDDMKTYQTFDFDASEWKVVDHTDLAAIKSTGINAEKLADIDRAAWDKLIKGKSGIGFAYLMGIDAIADQCAIDQLTLQANMKGSWK